MGRPPVGESRHDSGQAGADVRAGRFLPRAELPLNPQRIPAALPFLGLWERRAAAAGSQIWLLDEAAMPELPCAVTLPGPPGRARLAVPTPDGHPAMAPPEPLLPRGWPAGATRGTW